MAFEQKNNEGVIFANDNKVKDQDPDGKGSATIDGIEYWVSSWVNKSQAGKPYRKIAFTRKDQQSTHQGSRPQNHNEGGF